MMSRFIVGCEDPPVVSSPSNSTTSVSKDSLPTSTPKPAAVTPPISPLPTPTHVLPTPPPPVPPSVSPPSSLPTSVGSIPQKILPSFLLKRFSMPTLLKKSPDKRENLLSSFPNVESIPEHPSVATPTSIAPPTLIPDSSVTLTTPTTTSSPSPVLQSFPSSTTQSNTPTLSPAPINNNNNNTSTTGSSSNKGRHTRSHSVDYSLQPSSLQRPSIDSSVSFGSQWSVESISLLSENPSELSYETALTAPLSPLHPPDPADNSGCGCFQFKPHFSLFSQYTSSLALEYNSEEKGEELSDRLSSLTPPIWCLDALNGTAAVGCGNGQIEVC